MNSTSLCRAGRWPALLVLSAALPLLAQQQPPASWKDLKYPPLKQIQLPKIEEVTLPNGMKVYLLENHELPLVRGLALVRTGNLFDPADKIGLADVTGSLIRGGGTAAKTGNQIDEELENIAATVESQIGESYGSVSFSTLKERTDEVLSTFHDVLTAPAFREDRLELIRNQLRSGISRRNDDAHGIAQREFAEAIYGANTSYGWRMEYATIDKIQRPDIIAFYKRYFFPANVILAVQGDFSAPEMKARLEKLFSDWNEKQSPVPPFPPVTNAARPGIRLAVKTDITQTNFSMGHLGGLLKDKDYPALEVMADILGGGFQSRLFQKVRTQLGYAYEVNAYWGADFDHPGVFEISGSTKSASTTETIKAINAEIERIRTQEVTEEELNSAKQTVVNGFVFNFDTPAKTLNRLLTYRYYGYPDDFIFQYQKAVEQVTRADVLRVAKQYIDPAKFVTVAVGNPKEFGAALTSLGPVTPIDLTIPSPAAPAAQGRNATDTVAAKPQNAESAPPATVKVVDPKAAEARAKATLAKVAEALGGAAALAAVKDITQVAQLAIDASAGGLKVNQNISWLAPDLYREENTLPNGTKVMVFSNGKDGWAASPQGVQDIPDSELKQVSFELFRMWFSMLSPDSTRMVSQTAPDKIDVTDGANDMTLTIDPQTNMPVSESYSEVDAPLGTVVETFSDWQTTAGVKLPHKTVISQNGMHFADVTVSRVVINSGLTAAQISKKP
jgi:zinc protease